MWKRKSGDRIFSTHRPSNDEEEEEAEAAAFRAERMRMQEHERRHTGGHNTPHQSNDNIEDEGQIQQNKKSHGGEGTKEVAEQPPKKSGDAKAFNKSVDANKDQKDLKKSVDAKEFAKKSGGPNLATKSAKELRKSVKDLRKSVDAKFFRHSFDNIKDFLHQGQVGTKQDAKVEGKKLVLVGEDKQAEDSETDSKKIVDSMQMLKSAHAILRMGQRKQKEVELWENEDDDYPSEEYYEMLEKQRMDKIYRDRGKCVSRTFLILFHITVIASFLMSFYDSFRITVENSKLQSYHLFGIFNCMGVLEKGDWVDHVVNIFHALMSVCVLFAESRATAGLCMAYVFSQAIHTAFKAFQFLMQIRFEPGTIIGEMTIALFITIICNVLTSVVVIQKFYDLTDRIRSRAKSFAASISEHGSVNEEIIYQNQSSFLQRKQILREAIASQVYKIIQTIGTFHARGLEPDYVLLYRQIYAAKMALADVENVENAVLFKELKKANAKRLKDIEEHPEQVEIDKNITSGALSKLFVVTFQDRI